jgi:hypothetical protein
MTQRRRPAGPMGGHCQPDFRAMKLFKNGGRDALRTAGGTPAGPTFLDHLSLQLVQRIEGSAPDHATVGQGQKSRPQHGVHK